MDRLRLAAFAGLVGVLALLLGSLVLPGAPARADGVLVTSPALDGEVLQDTPRVLTVPGGEKVQLFDAWGVPIPFTGAGQSGEEVLLPSLPPGRYTLAASGATAEFEITVPTFTAGHDYFPMPDQGALGENSVVPWLLLAGLAAAGLGSVVFAVRRRRVLLALGGLAAVTVAGVAVVLTSPSVVSAAEPPTYQGCLTLAGGDTTNPVFNDCSFDRMVWKLDTAGLVPALDEFDAQANPSCHEVAHQFGTYMWVRFRDPNYVLTPGLGACNDAYYHGALYGASTYSTDEEFLDLLAVVCENTAEPGDLNGDCYHGMGHGLAMRFGGDSLRALEACDALAPAPGTPSNECRGAVYMMHAVKAKIADGNAAFMPTPAVDVLELCEGESDKELVGFCFTSVAMAADWDRGTPLRMMQLCNEVPIDRGQACAWGMAGQFRSWIPGGSPEGARVCLELKEREWVRTCVEQYAYFVFDQFRDEGMLGPICAAADFPVDVCRMHYALPDTSRSQE